MRSASWRALLGGLAAAGSLAALSAGSTAGAALAIGRGPTPVVMQPESPLTAAPSPTAFNVAPAFQAFVRTHGGARTLGAPISTDFALLGKRVQVFELQVLELRPNGSVAVMSLIDDGLPLSHAEGRTFPSRDPGLAGAVPSLSSDDYTGQALSAIDAGLLDQNAPDDWSGLPVNFTSTFRGTVICDDLSADASCDETALASGALDMWGLPTSPPASDPADPNLVYVRFQRGIMQYSQLDGQTQPVPMGKWFKRVLLGSDVPSDLLADVVGTRFYAQYAPDLPLAVARPSELPASSLTAAFGTTVEQTAAGRIPYAGPTPPPVLAPAVPDFGTPSATTTSTPGPTSPVVAPLALTTPTIASTSTAPQGPDPCAGDEQLLFAPRKPYAGTDVLIAASSASHHDARSVRLAGPIKTGQPNERQGLLGWVWEWTVSPPFEGWYEFSFYSDSARLCATAGFNALPSFGATPTLTPAAQATAIPTATTIPTVTPTATATVIPAPTLASVNPDAGGCNQVLFVQGQNFGYPQTQVSGQVFFVGPGGTRPAAVLGWGTTQITISVPTGALPGGIYSVIVQANGIASNSKPFTLLGTCS